MPTDPSPRIICLSNVHDANYAKLRNEEIDPALSSSKRRDLFRCLEMATNRPVVVLSSPPKALHRRVQKWLPAVTTQFSTHLQYFCPNWDVPKLRVPLSWLLYARHVLRHTRSGDLVMIDNYEFIYVFAFCVTRLFRRLSLILDYEDGKHLTDRSWHRVLSSTAEWLARWQVRAAIVAHPALARRLPKDTPTALVAGFIVKSRTPALERTSDEVGFLYSGSLDRTRGVDLLLGALKFLPPEGWRLDLSGAGPLEREVMQAVTAPTLRGKVKFHGALAASAHLELLKRCDVGINCQRSSDPISSVTFPSKIFTYLSAGLLVVSSRASEVQSICGEACIYFSEERPEMLAATMTRVVKGFAELKSKALRAIEEKYSLEQTALRLQQLLSAARLL